MSIQYYFNGLTALAARFTKVRLTSFRAKAFMKIECPLSDTRKEFSLK